MSESERTMNSVHTVIRNYQEVIGKQTKVQPENGGKPYQATIISFGQTLASVCTDPKLSTCRVCSADFCKIRKN